MKLYVFIKLLAEHDGKELIPQSTPTSGQGEGPGSCHCPSQWLEFITGCSSARVGDGPIDKLARGW